MILAVPLLWVRLEVQLGMVSRDSETLRLCIPSELLIGISWAWDMMVGWTTYWVDYLNKSSCASSGWKLWSMGWVIQFLWLYMKSIRQKEDPWKYSANSHLNSVDCSAIIAGFFTGGSLAVRSIFAPLSHFYLIQSSVCLAALIV